MYATAENERQAEIARLRAALEHHRQRLNEAVNEDGRQIEQQHIAFAIKKLADLGAVET